MTDVLGYGASRAQGGDWGAFITSRARAIAIRSALIGIHLNLLAVRRDPKLPNPNAEEKSTSTQLDHWLKEETGYQWIQGTKPQTLAFGADRFAGRARRLDRREVPHLDRQRRRAESAVSRDDMLANISLYWFTGAIGSSFWPYYARMHGPWPIPDGERSTVPTGYAEFPKEILRPPRSLAERTYTDIRRWTRDAEGRPFRGAGAARGAGARGDQVLDASTRGGLYARRQFAARAARSRAR